MPIRDGRRFENQQYVTSLYLSYTNKVNRLLDPIHVYPVVAVPNHLPVLPPDPVLDHHSIALPKSIPVRLNHVPVEHSVVVPNSTPIPPFDPVFDAVATPNTLSDSPVNLGIK